MEKKIIINHLNRAAPPVALIFYTQQKQNQMTSINLGNIGCKTQAEKIKAKLQGQSWMNFEVIIFSIQNKWPVTIATEDTSVTKKQLRRMVTFVLATEL